MKKYLADLLTLTRFILSTILIVLTIVGTDAGTALILFALAELTDAFDGTCSKKWPFPKNRIPKYRKYAEKYDMWADVLTLIAMFAFVIFRVNFWLGLGVALAMAIFCTAIELWVYGKLFGHPNDFRPKSLFDRDKKRAEKILLRRRSCVYIPCIAILVLSMLFVTSWPLWLKFVLLGVALGVAVFLWFFLTTRRKNVARD